MKIYYETATEARDAGRLDEYRESMQENRRTRDAIDAAIAAHFDGWRLAPEALTQVLETCDAERVAIVLAATLENRSHDGRFSSSARTWAAGVRLPADADARRWLDMRSHSAIINGYIDMFREATEN